MEYRIVIDRKAPSIDDVKNFLLTEKSGAIFIFNGIVRNSNRKKEVAYLEYEVDEETGKSVLKEYLKNFESRIQKAFIFQPTGKLSVGDDTLIIGASSYSREESFDAVRNILEFMKHKFPVWKKEYYKDGENHWL